MNLNSLGALCWCLCGFVLLLFLVSVFPFGFVLIICIVIPFVIGWIVTGKRIEQERQAENEFQRLQEENERLKRELDKDK